MYKVYIYCCKAKPYLVYGTEMECDQNWHDKYCLTQGYNKQEADKIWGSLNGKIVASFDLNDVEEIEYSIGRRNRNCECYIDRDYEIQTYFYDEKTLLKKSCVTRDELYNYFVKELDNGETYLGYAWHIDNLEILDKPIKLKDSIFDISSYFYIKKITGNMVIHQALTKAPQSWCYAYDNKDNKCIIISIKPEWVCKILNGEKTIEIRKTKPNVF